MLIVVEDRDIQPLAEFSLHIKALRRLDVLQVDTAEGRLQRGDDVDQPVGVPLVDFDIETIDPREFLEQDRLAFHDRLGRQRADGTEPEHGGAVGDDADQIAARGEVPRFGGIAHDLLAGRRHPGRVSQRQVALIGQALGRRDGDFSGGQFTVIVEGGFAQGFIHGVDLSVS